MEAVKSTLSRTFFIISYPRFPGEFALKFASKELRNHREIALVSVIKNGCSLIYPSETLKNDREIVLAALEHQATNMHHALQELRNDCEQ